MSQEDVKVDTTEMKLESWMQFLIITITLLLQFYYQREKFSENNREMNILKQFSSTITTQKILKALKQTSDNVNLPQFDAT